MTSKRSMKRSFRGGASGVSGLPTQFGLDRLFPLVLTLSICQWAFGQGTVLFYNHAPQVGLDAPVFDVDGKTGLIGFQFRAQLFAGPVGGSLSPLGAPLSFNFRPGYWGGADESMIRTVPGVQSGESATGLVKVWSTILGGTYEQAAAAGGKHGESAIFSFLTGGDTKGGTQPPGLPGYLTGLKSFAVTGVEPIPEPSPLGLLSLVVFLFSVSYPSRHRGKTIGSATH